MTFSTVYLFMASIGFFSAACYGISTTHVSWKDVPDVPDAPTTADHLLVLGGEGFSGKTSSVEYLSFSGSTCASPVPDLPTAVYGHSTVITSTSRLVSCGGKTSSGQTSSCWTWTPGSQSWTTGPSLPINIYYIYYIIYGDMVTTEEKILYIGGYSKRKPGGYRDEIYAIDTGLTDQWTQVASLTTARGGHCSAAYDGNIITTGGWGDSGHLSSVEMYQLGASSTTTLPSLNDARSYPGCSLFTTTNGDLQLIVTGGYGSRSYNDYLSSVEISTKTGSGWSSFVKTDNALPGWRLYHTTTLIGQKLYTVGGWTSSSNQESSILVSDNGTTWTTSATSLTTGRRRHTAVATTDLC